MTSHKKTLSNSYSTLLILKLGNGAHQSLMSQVDLREKYTTRRMKDMAHLMKVH